MSNQIPSAQTIDHSSQSWWEDMQDMQYAQREAVGKFGEKLQEGIQFLYKNPLVLVLGIISILSLCSALLLSNPEPLPSGVSFCQNSPGIACFGAVAAISGIAAITLGIFRKGMNDAINSMDQIEFDHDHRE